jgi:tRNA (guanine10-N2)-dimethyltransferase
MSFGMKGRIRTGPSERAAPFENDGHRHTHHPSRRSTGVRLFIELSGEHPTLPRAEALAAMAAERIDLRSTTFGPQLLRLDAVGPAERAARRLGLAHLVCEELASGDFDSIRSFARSQDLGGRTFRVRARGLGVEIEPRGVEEPLGADFGRTGRVDLDAPQVDYRVLVGEEFVLGRILHRVDRARLEATKVAHRSFSLPISLHPKFARALVNLAEIPMAGTVLDPFCGTGGILLEAAELGFRAVGFDREEKMVRGARSSCAEVGKAPDFAVADAGRLPVRQGSVHGIATDPPYGRAASTRGEPVNRLYERAFDAFVEVLHRGAHVAIVLPTEKAIEIGMARMELAERHAVRVHRSLARHFCVFVKA